MYLPIPATDRRYSNDEFDQFPTRVVLCRDLECSSTLAGCGRPLYSPRRRWGRRDRVHGYRVHGRRQCGGRARGGDTVACRLEAARTGLRLPHLGRAAQVAGGGAARVCAMHLHQQYQKRASYGHRKFMKENHCVTVKKGEKIPKKKWDRQLHFFS